MNKATNIIQVKGSRLIMVHTTRFRYIFSNLVKVELVCILLIILIEYVPEIASFFDVCERRCVNKFTPNKNKINSRALR